MGNSLIEQARKQKLETVASACMVLVGFGLPLVDPSNRLLLLAGSTMATLGGAMLTTVLSSSREFHRAEFERELDPLLDSISRTLGEAVQQLKALVLETNEELIDADTAMARVSVVLPTLRGAITDVLRLAGKNLDLSDYIETQERLKDLQSAAQELQGELTESKLDHAKVSKLAEQIGQQAVSIAAKTDAPPSVTENVRCPNCSWPASVELGSAPGSTVMPLCRNCGARFYVHRNRDSSSFTRLPPRWVKSSTPPSHFNDFEITCPNTSCGNVIPVSVAENGSATRFCVSCGEKVTVDSAGGITAHQARPLVAAAVIEGLTFIQANCPEHGFVARTFTRIGNRAFGVCIPGDHLVYRTFPSSDGRESAAPLPREEPPTDAAGSSLQS